MKITDVLLLAIAPVSFRIDWLISRACRPTCESPISPSSSFLGTRAATESITITSTALRLDQHFGDVHRLFAMPRLADQQRFQVDAQFLRPTGVEGVFGVDERGDPARSLGLGDHMQGQRRFAARLRTIDFDDPSAGNPLPSQGDIERQAPRRNSLDPANLSAAQGHDRTFAKLLFDRFDRIAEFLTTEQSLGG